MGVNWSYGSVWLLLSCHRFGSIRYHGELTMYCMPPPLPIFCMSLSVNTPDSDHQHIRSALRALTVFRLTCSLHRVHCSLLPEQGKSVVVYFTSEHSFMVCTAQRLQAQMSAISNTVPLIYTILIHVSHTYMRFEWNTFDSNWNRGGISCDVHFAGHLRSKCAEQGARGLELRTAGLHTACHLQVVLTRLFIKARCRLLK